MAYDSARGVTVLFGGYKGSLDGETWEYDGTAWALRAYTGPSPRSGHGMAYDPAGEVTLLYGGFDGANSDETWAWDGQEWTQLDTKQGAATVFASRQEVYEVPTDPGAPLVRTEALYRWVRVPRGSRSPAER
jgi:hypothetical protein